MALVALGPFTRQVDTAGNGGMTVAVPATQPGDLLVAVGSRFTQQPNSGFSMGWVDPPGWFRVAEARNWGGLGTVSTPRSFLAVWVTLASAGASVDLTWTGNGQSDNSRVGDVGVVAAYRPAPADAEIVAQLGIQEFVRDVPPLAADSPPWTFAAFQPGIALCASHLAGDTGPYGVFDLAGFEARGSSVDTQFRPELHISDTVHGTGTLPGPRWSGARHHTQLIVGNIPLPRRGGLNLGLVRGRRGVG